MIRTKGALARRRVKQLLCTLLLLLSAIGVSAEDLTLTAAPNPAAVYQKVGLTVIVPSANPETVSASFPSGLAAIHVVSGPYVQPFTANDSAGKPTVKVSFVIEGNEAGRIVVPSLQISADNTDYSTRPIVLSFGVPNGGKLVVPLRPVWTIPNRAARETYYVGEAIPVVLELRNETENRTIDSVRITNPPPGLEQAKELASISRREVGTTTLLQIPVASFILTPTSAGTVSLPSATVQAGGASGVSAPRALQVRPVPDAVSESGAVGSFSFRSWTTKRPVADGEEISLHLRIEGSGNLKHLVLPVPSSTGMIEIGKNQTKHISASVSGYTGFREIVYQYLLQSNSPGAAGAGMVTVPRFSWLDPKGGVQSAAARTISISAPSVSSSPGSALPGKHPVTEQAAGAKPNHGNIPFTLEPASVIRRSEYREFYSNGRTYLWLLPGPIVFGLFLLTRPRGRSRSKLLGAAVFVFLLSACAVSPVDDSLVQGTTAYAKGEVAQAAKDFVAAQGSFPRNAALSFDLGIAEYRLGRYGEAIHSIRTAIYYAPLSAKYRSVLQWMVDQIGIQEQVPPAYPIHPDLFLFLLIGGINLAAILGVLVVMKRSGRLAIALILVLVISTISAGGLAYTSVRRSVETAVVKSSGTEMTKIPMAVAGRWLELPAGMAVDVRDSVSGYYLVETAYGNTGWVRKDRVLIDGR